MKIKDIRSMDDASLKDKLTELRKELIKINAQVAIGTTPKNPGQVKAIKKNIARVLTIIKEKSTDDKKKTEKKVSDKKSKEVEKKA